ncbi:MAG: hypothetical protein ACYDIE_01075 [Candidatus Krumholzibacteriia bacterium]
MSTASRCTRPAEVLVAVLVLFALGANPAVAAVADHLLLSELVVQTRTEVPAAKYIELVNPTASAIDLSTVYVTDATYNTPPTYYYNIVKLDSQGGGGTGGDFLARFPGGASIAAGDTIAVAITGSGDFQTAYGHLPDYELYEDGIAPDSVPELVEAFPGSIGRGLGNSGTNVPDLSSVGESAVLFSWNGQTDLVQDLDYALWGSSSLLAVRVSKTGVRIDGPDAGTDSTAYLPDTDVAAQKSISSTVHAFGNSFQRRSADEGTEVAVGGNGLTGHNETSEQLNLTWTATLPNTPAAAPVTVTPPAPIITAATLQPAAPEAGQAVTVAATVLAYDSVSGVSVFWSDNGTSWTEVPCTSTGLNTWAGQIPARPLDTIVLWYVGAVAAGGGRATKPVAAPIYYQSYTVVAAPEPADYPPLLFITEVCVLGSPQEFVEIANPTGAAVDLSNYYLTDAIHAPAGQFYWNIVLPNPSQATVGGGLYTDFHARFPDGASIAAGDTITISIAGSDAFLASYGFLPDYELFEDGASPDDVPDMREVFPGSINGGSLPSLTNTGEIVVLYYWNGATDLVTDIDVFAWGTGTSFLFDKTGVSMDGPDAGTTPTAYKPDTPVASQQLFTTVHGYGESYQRIDPNEGTEIKTGGNGTLGHNETSENLLSTFHIAAASPSPPGGGAEGGVTGEVAIDVPARTFLPLLGETFPIRFRSQRGAQTEVRIYDLTGQLVLTLFDSRYDGAAASVPGQWTRRDWDGRDRQFELLPAGLYVVHLSAVDPRSGKEKTKTAPVVLATRLSK